MLFGFALAVTRLKACTRAEILGPQISEQERQLGYYSAGRFGWELEGTRRLDTAFELRGQQGLFDWDPPQGWEWKFRQ